MVTKSKVLVVTGSEGFIGSHLVEELNKQGYNVKGYDLKNKENLIDFDSRFDLEGADTVFHLATLPLPLSLTEPYKVVEGIITMSLNLCEQCRQGYFKTLIQISSSEAFGSAQYIPMDEDHPLDVRTPYAAGKASADLVLLSYIRTFGVDATIVRPFNNYGERQPVELGGIIPATIARILKGNPPVIYGDGEQIRDFIYVKDTVRGIIGAWKEKKTRGRVVNISGGCPLRIHQLVTKIMELMEYKGKIQYLPERKADVQVHYASGLLATDLFGFNPKYSIDQGLKKTIEWYERNGK